MKRNLLLASLLSAASSAYALDGAVDPRSVGMGGAGVATANGVNAVYQNPSKLADLPNEKFTFEAPFAMRVLDSGDLVNKLDTLNSEANAMSSALSSFNGTPGTAGNAGAAVSRFSNALASANTNTLTGALYGGLFFALPKAGQGYALKIDSRTEFGSTIDYVSADQTQINSIATNLTNCGAGNATACSAAQGQTTGGKINNLTSGVVVRGVMLADVGVSAARHFDNFGGVDIGVTPKFIKITSFDSSQSIQSGNASSSSTSGNQKSESMFSFDLGASKSFKTAAGHNVTTGAVMKNVVSKTLKTALGNTIEIAPQVTAGAAYGAGWFTGTADVDLIKNKAVITSLTKESQFVRLGAEFDAKGWAQIRLGYRHDITGNYAGLPSIGLGLNLKVLNLDASLAAVNKKELVAAIQLGTHF